MRFDDATIAAIKDRTDLVALIGRDVPLRLSAGEYWALCPLHGESTPSFHVVPKGRFWKCFGCGEGGDCFAYLQKTRRLAFAVAARQLAEAAGMITGAGPAAIVTPSAEERAARDAADAANAKLRHEKNRERAFQAWSAAVPEHPILKAYLDFRVPGTAGSPALRLIPAMAYHDHAKNRLGEWPVMIAAMRHPDGRFAMGHRTYLAPDGKGKASVPSAKKLMGAPRDSAIWLTPLRPRMLMGEGIETCLAALQALEPRGFGAWCGYSLTHLAGAGLGIGERHPTQAGRRLDSEIPDPRKPGLVLPGIKSGDRRLVVTADGEPVEELVLLGDGDTKDKAMARATMRRAEAKFRAQGVAKVWTFWAEAGMDFADMGRGG